jgi:ribonucleoside-triphosphate reductase
MGKCKLRTDVYSRVCGYCRPVANWNVGKREEFRNRRVYNVGKAESGGGMAEGKMVGADARAEAAD